MSEIVALEQLEMFSLPISPWRDRLDELSTSRLEVCAEQVRVAVKLANASLIGVGLALSEAKSRLPYGTFGLWLLEEFQWQERTAQRFIQVAREFQNVSVTDLSYLDRTALYVLAGGKTPESARAEAVERASSGEHVTGNIAREIVARHSGGNGSVAPLSPGEEFELEQEIEKQEVGDCSQCPRCGHRW
jgi:hypothetical protein